MDRQTDEKRTDGRADRRAEKGRTGERTDRRTDGQADIQTDGRAVRQRVCTVSVIDKAPSPRGVESLRTGLRRSNDQRGIRIIRNEHMVRDLETSI